MKNHKRLSILIVLVCICIFQGAADAGLKVNNIVQAESGDVWTSCVKDADRISLWWGSSFGLTLDIPSSGKYRVFFRASGTEAFYKGKTYPELEMSVAYRPQNNFVVDTINGEWGVYISTVLYLDKGTYDLRFDFLNDYGNDTQDRNVFIDWIGLMEVGSDLLIPNLMIEGYALESWGRYRYGVSTGGNLLINSSFELTDGGGWHPWTYSGSATFNMFDSTEAIVGHRSASIRDATGDVIITYDGVAIDPNQDYVLSGWIKTDLYRFSRAYLGLIFYSESGWLNASSSDLMLRTEELTGVNGWTFVQVAVPSSLIPKETIYINPCLGVLGVPGETGVAYFDGITFHPATSPSPQPVLKNSGQKDSVKLTCDSSLGEDVYAYYIFEGEEPDFEIDYDSWIYGSDKRDISWEMPEGVKYYRAITLDKFYTPSSPSIAVKSDIVPPNPVTALTIDSSQTGAALLEWEVPSGEIPTKYRVYVSKDEDQVLDNPTAIYELTSQDKGFANTPGETVNMWCPTQEGTFYFTVTAIDAAENESSPSPVQSAQIFQDNELPKAPENVNVFVDQDPDGKLIPRGLAQIKWTEPQEAAIDGDYPLYYLIYRSQQENPRQTGIQLAKIDAESPGTEHTFLDSTVKGEVFLYYEVYAVDKAGNLSVSTGEMKVKVTSAVAPKLKEPLNSTPVTITKKDSNKLELFCESIDTPADFVEEYIVELSRDQAFAKNCISLNDYEVDDDGDVKFLVPNALLGEGEWFWRVKALYKSGVVSYSTPRSLMVVLKGFEQVQPGLVQHLDVAPKVISLESPATILALLKNDALVDVRVFDTKGRVVKVLMEDAPCTGNDLIRIMWDGTDELGRRLPNGLYFIKIFVKAENEIPYSAIKRVQIFR